MHDEGRERVATWMTKNGYATGHGDTIEDLLGELRWQLLEEGARAPTGGMASRLDAQPHYANTWPGRGY